jgi:RNA polymerase sigma-54 factor
MPPLDLNHRRSLRYPHRTSTELGNVSNMAGPGFSQSLSHRQTQSLVLAPQLRHSLKILQVAALDLRTVIQEELQANPTLEELPMEGVSLDRETAEHAPESDGEDHRSKTDEVNFSKEFEILSKLDQDWRDHMANAGGNQPQTSEDAERREHFFNSLVSETSLQEHLMNQVEMADVDDAVVDSMRYLVGSLDDRGFVTQTVSDIALQTGLPLESVQQAHALLKTFDPPGIGAETLSECLLIQLEIKGRGEALPARIVRNYFELLIRRRIPDLARKAGASLEDVQLAVEEIGTLDPAPGRRFADDSNRVVVPDVSVTKDEAEWKIILNNDYIPRLRISNTYKEMIAKGSLTRDEREYVRERMRSGRFLINSIEQRQQTIERVTREIIKAQVDFFEEGVSKLRPLTMTQIADIVGVHETTVSRAIANKYIQTPHGVFGFKYFFTPGYKSNGGDSVSNTSVKEMINDLITVEDRARPYSDQELVAKLQEKGIKIARRTVAKYREELGILPSNLRREYT